MFFLTPTSRTRHTRAGCERCKRCGVFQRFPTITRARWRITNFRRPNKMGLRSLNQSKTVPSINSNFPAFCLAVCGKIRIFAAWMPLTGKKRH